MPKAEARHDASQELSWACLKFRFQSFEGTMGQSFSSPSFGQKTYCSFCFSSTPQNAPSFISACRPQLYERLRVNTSEALHLTDYRDVICEGMRVSDIGTMQHLIVRLLYEHACWQSSLDDSR
jgi:hypothetical protein